MGMKYDLEGKVVLVTGGSRGIGLELAARLVEDEKARVIICGRKPENLEAALGRLDAGEQVTALAAHIAKEDQVDALFGAIKEKFGRLDVLINNVGMNLLTASVAETEPGLWQKIIDTNLTGTFLCSRRAAEIMKAQGSGKIVNLSSLAATRAALGMGIYGVAKSAVEMMTRVMAAELASFNIQVNAVAPCMVKTDFSKPFWSHPEMHDQIVKTIPAGRLPDPVDIVHPILFLASPGADFITGQTLAVDGGASAI